MRTMKKNTKKGGERTWVNGIAAEESMFDDVERKYIVSNFVSCISIYFVVVFFWGIEMEK